MYQQIAELEAYYMDRLNQGADPSRQLGWESVEAHYSRFQVLADSISLNYKRILDVGSGLGDLWYFIRESGYICDYTGNDILPIMIDRSRKRFPGIQFELYDPIYSLVEPGKPYDIVYASGIFNLKGCSDLSYVKKAFSAFARCAREAIVLTFLDVRSSNPEPRYCYYDPREMIDILSGKGWKLEIRDEYLQNDFTLVARKEGHQ